MEKLKITLRKGLVGCTVRQRETVKTLGLHKIGQSVVRDASPANLGLVNAVRHLVEVEEVK